jgi:SAM-dependent methyltransferase
MPSVNDPQRNAAEVTKYHATVQFDGAPDVHALAVGAVPVGSFVLDVGCADGSVAKLLRDRGAEVVGMDADPVALAAASPHLVAAINIDLEVDLRRRLQQVVADQHEKRFDAVLLLDVLEHVRDPTETLRAVVEECLAPHGRVILSIPNIAHGSIRLSLLEGRFNYSDKGLLDETHVRFFTRVHVDALLAQVGLRPIIDYPYEAGFDATDIPVHLGSFSPAVLEAISTDPESFVFQHFVVAVPVTLSAAGSFEIASVAISRNQMAQRNEFDRTIQYELSQARRHYDNELARQQTEARSAFQLREEQLLLALEDTKEQVRVVQAQRDAAIGSSTYRVGRVLLTPLRYLRRGRRN